MYITLNTQLLQEKLDIVSRVSTKHVTLPVLQCVLLETTKDKLILRATNLEIGIEAVIEGEVTEEGVVAVPAAVLLQTVNLNKHKDITLRAEEGTVIVEGSGSETQIKCVPYEEFPTIPHLKESGQTLNKDQFALGIKTAAFAASVSSIKPELGSVYVYQKKEHTLTFVATDSFRLMEKTVTQKGVVLDTALLIPQKNALEIARLCERESSEVILRVNENQCSLEFSDGVYITSRLTTGSFPDYVQIIPKEYETHTIVLKDDLIQSFKKTNIFLNKFLQVSLHVTEQSLTISANSGEVGTTTESMPAQTDGGELTLNFNQRYVSEALSHFTDDNLKLNLAGLGRPMVITGTHDASIRYLVMPMNK